MWFKIIFACLPAAVVGILFDDILEEKLQNYIVVAISLIVFGVLFILVENWNKNKKSKINSLAEITYTTAVLIGVFPADCGYFFRVHPDLERRF